MQLLAACVAGPAEVEVRARRALPAATDQGLLAADIASDVVVQGRVGVRTAGRPPRLQQPRQQLHDTLGQAAEDGRCDRVLALGRQGEQGS